MYKTIFLGDMSTGKTSFLVWIIKGQTESDLMPTVGVQIGMKTFKLGEPEKEIQYNLQFWDTAGQQRFRSICYQHYKNAHAALLFFDLSKKQTFLNLESWIADIKQYAQNAELLICLLGNKVDKRDSREVTKQEIDVFMQKHKIGFYSEMSTLTRENLQKTLSDLVKFVVQKSPNQKRHKVLKKPQTKSCC